jgi:hypothetical protein
MVAEDEGIYILKSLLESSGRQSIIYGMEFRYFSETKERGRKEKDRKK